MGNIDALTELATTLDIFFKGLSECNLLTTYSLQLQATTVDSTIPGEFQFLVQQFVKNLQTLLYNIPCIASQDIGYNVGTQTDDPGAGYIELKAADLSGPTLEPQPEVNYVLDQHAWGEAKQHTFINSVSEVIITCAPETLAVVTPSESSPSAAPAIEEPEDSTAVTTAAAIFICELCDKSFNSARSLAQHLGVKHKTCRGQCDMCSQRFPSLQGLQEHCRSAHNGSGCFTCSVCGRRFMTKLSYSRHVDAHNGKKGAVCDICGKLLSRADYLAKHYMTHNGLRPHACAHCPRRFVSSSQLKVHQRTHTGRKDHSCQRCPKTFSRSDKLKEHMLRHLAIKRFTCSQCDRSYAEKRDLTKHLRLHSISHTDPLEILGL